MPDKLYDIAVIGEGISGLSAAGAAAQSGLRVASFEQLLYGGLVTNINVLLPSPDTSTISGLDFASTLVHANLERGVESIQQTVKGIETDGSGFLLRTEESIYGARRVVIASGARLRPLGIPGETEFVGRGVSSCADCDGPMYRGRRVVVVGGGDSAAQEALVLAELCEHVQIVTRGRRLTARADLVAQLEDCRNVTTLTEAEPIRVLGNQGVEQLVVRHDGRFMELPCTGIFPYVGLVPNSDCVPSSVEMDALGHVGTDVRFETSLQGVFAAGAVRADYAGMLTDALREGAAAGRFAAATLPRP